MSSSRFKVVDIKWWQKPIPLMLRERDKEGNYSNFKRVGWVWNQRAYLVNNIHEGWIAFAEDQTEENLNVWNCPHCGELLWGSQREKIIKHLRKQEDPK